MEAIKQFIPYITPNRTFDDCLSLWILDADYTTLTQLPNCISSYKQAYITAHENDFPTNPQPINPNHHHPINPTRNGNLFGACRFLTVLLQRAKKLNDGDYIDYIITPLLLLYPRDTIPFLLEPKSLYTYLNIAKSPDINRQLRFVVSYHFPEFVSFIHLPLLFYHNDSPATTTTTTTTSALEPSFYTKIAATDNLEDIRQIILDNLTVSNYPISFLLPIGNENQPMFDVGPRLDAGGEDGDFAPDDDIPPLWRTPTPHQLASSPTRFSLQQKHIYLEYSRYVQQCEAEWRSISMPAEWRSISMPSAPQPQPPHLSGQPSQPQPPQLSPQQPSPQQQQEQSPESQPPQPELVPFCFTCCSNRNIIQNPMHTPPKPSDSLRLAEEYNVKLNDGECNPAPPPPIFSTYPFPFTPTPQQPPLDIFATFNIQRPNAMPITNLKDWFNRFMLALRLVPFFHPNFSGIPPSRYNLLLDYIVEWAYLMLYYCPSDAYMINALLNRTIPEWVQGHQGVLRAFGYDVTSIDVITPQAFVVEHTAQYCKGSESPHITGELGYGTGPGWGGEHNYVPGDTHKNPRDGDASLLATLYANSPIYQGPHIHNDSEFFVQHDFHTPMARFTTANEQFQGPRVVIILHHALVPFIMSTPTLFYTSSLLSTSVANTFTALRRNFDQLKMCPHPCKHCFEAETSHIDQQLFSMLDGEPLVHIDTDSDDGAFGSNSDSDLSDSDDDDEGDEDNVDDRIILRPLPNFFPQNINHNDINNNKDDDNHNNIYYYNINNGNSTPTQLSSQPCNHTPHIHYWEYMGQQYLIDLINHASFWSFSRFPAIVEHAMQLEYRSWLVQSSRRFASSSTDASPSSHARTLDGRATSSGTFLDDDNQSSLYKHLPSSNRQRVVQALFEVYVTIQTLENPGVLQHHVASLIDQTFNHYFPKNSLDTTNNNQFSKFPDVIPAGIANGDDDEKQDPRSSHYQHHQPRAPTITTPATTPTAKLITPTPPLDERQPLPTLYQYLIGYIYSENSRSLTNFVLNLYLIFPFFANFDVNCDGVDEGPSTFIKFLMITSKLNLFNFQHTSFVDPTINTRYGYFVIASTPIVNPVLKALNNYLFLSTKVLSAIVSFPERISLLVESGDDDEQIATIFDQIDSLLLSTASPSPTQSWITNFYRPLSTTPTTRESYANLLSNITNHHSSLHELQQFAADAFLEAILQVFPSHIATPTLPIIDDENSPSFKLNDANHWPFYSTTTMLSTTPTSHQHHNHNHHHHYHHQQQRHHPTLFKPDLTPLPPEVLPMRKPTKDYSLVTIHPHSTSQSSLLFLAQSLAPLKARPDLHLYPPYTISKTISPHSNIPNKSRQTALSSHLAQTHHASLSTKPYSIFLAANIPSGHRLTNIRMTHISKTFTHLAGIHAQYQQQQQQQVQQQRQQLQDYDGDRNGNVLDVGGDEELIPPPHQHHHHIRHPVGGNDDSDDEDNPFGHHQPHPQLINNYTPWTQRQLEEYSSYLNLLQSVDHTVSFSLEIWINALCCVLLHPHQPDSQL